MSDAQKPRPFLFALSGLRAVPALVLVLAHMVACWRVMVARPPEGTSPEFLEWCARGVAALTEHPLALGLMRSTTAALGAFFMLSGFVLVYVYSTASPTREFDRKIFWAARIARIYPIYLLGLIFSVRLFLSDTLAAHSAPAAPPLTVLGWSTTILADLLLLQAWWPRAALAWNAPGWSLSCEAFFYLMFPRALRLVNRLRVRDLLVLIVVCWCVLMAVPLVYLALDPDHLGSVLWTSDGYWLRAVKFGPPIRFPEFLIGVAVGKLWFATEDRHDALRPWGPWLSLGGVLVWFVGGTLNVYLGVPYLLLHNGLLDLAFAAIIYGVALGGGPLHRFLSWRPVVLLGDSSYALYILHLPALTYVLHTLARFGVPPVHPLVFVVLFLATGAAVSVAVHRDFEIPSRILVRATLLGPRREDWPVVVRPGEPSDESTDDVANAG